MTISYKIIGLNSNNVLLEFEGIKMNFALPIVDGKFPEGEALNTLLSAYVSNAVTNRAVSIEATNADVIRALIEPKTTEQLKTEAVALRNQILVVTDWTQGVDSPLDTSTKELWKTYRQELRDITLQSTFPVTIVWPIPPAEVFGPYGFKFVNIDGTVVSLV